VPLHLDVEILFYDLVDQNEEELDPVCPLDLSQLLPINQVVGKKKNKNKNKNNISITTAVITTETWLCHRWQMLRN
jgi:hypothetical protein